MRRRRPVHGRLARTDAVGLPGSAAEPGGAEVYRTVATGTSSATSISLYLDEASTADRLILGLYADEGGPPTDLLASGTLSNPVAGDWTRSPCRRRRSQRGRPTGSRS